MSRRRVFTFFCFALVVLVVLLCDFTTRQAYNYFTSPKTATGNKSENLRGSGTKPPQAQGNLHRSSNAVFHHGFRPLAQGVDVFGPTRTKYFINSAGFRDGSCRTVDLSSMQKKILIIGDSYAEGIGVPWEQTVAGLLERDFAPKGVDVLNAAVASYCPSLMLAKLGDLYRQHKLRANVVVVFIDISDVEDELTYHRLPHGEFVSNSAPPWQDPAYATPDLVFLEWIRIHVEKNFTLLGAALRNLRILWRQLGSPGGTLELTRGTWPDYRGPAEPLVQQGLEKAASAMGEIARLVGTHGGRLIVVIYPWREQAESGVQPSRVEKFWNAWAQAHGVELVNLFPDFVPLGKEYEKRYCIPGDGHWNHAGHAHVEELLRPKLESALR